MQQHQQNESCEEAVWNPFRSKGAFALFSWASLCGSSGSPLICTSCFPGAREERAGRERTGRDRILVHTSAIGIHSLHSPFHVLPSTFLPRVPLAWLMCGFLYSQLQQQVSDLAVVCCGCSGMVIGCVICVPPYSKLQQNCCPAVIKPCLDCVVSLFMSCSSKRDTFTECCSKTESLQTVC